jgi:hypothetical protein
VTTASQPRTDVLRFRVEPTQHAAALATAAHLGISLSSLIREALAEKISRHSLGDAYGTHLVTTTAVTS